MHGLKYFLDLFKEDVELNSFVLFFSVFFLIYWLVMKYIELFLFKLQSICANAYHLVHTHYLFWNTCNFNILPFFSSFF